MTSVFHFVILTFASARLIRFLSLDSITQPARDVLLKLDWLLVRRKIARRYWFTKALECPWCGGFWCAAGVFAADRYAFSGAQAWDFALTVAAASWLIGIGGRLDGYPEDL